METKCFWGFKGGKRDRFSPVRIFDGIIHLQVEPAAFVDFLFQGFSKVSEGANVSHFFFKAGNLGENESDRNEI